MIFRHIKLTWYWIVTVFYYYRQIFIEWAGDYIYHPRCRKLYSSQVINYQQYKMSNIMRCRLSFTKKKYLVLDLDETLIHSKIFRVNQKVEIPDFKFTLNDIYIVNESREKIIMKKIFNTVNVYKRPHVDHFLKTVSQWYDLVVYTASVEVYGCSVVRWLENGYHLFKKCHYRKDCKWLDGTFVKDLTIISKDLSNILIIDNSPEAYIEYPNNGLPISTWTTGLRDVALLELLPFLDALRFTNNVQSILSRINETTKSINKFN
ncbi:hypothetical protein A3Q56_05958 [Intoshia linei]|uniref:FCP1 homology domain-containing protein n=1 Tax=Intoshia linei TaxID=1819745 RepID=A0A177AWF4_9BILA|nr:hypothetical protein A3Q56_05958 [Intoshia linei]